MIKDLLEDHLLKKSGPPREHPDRFYPTQSSTIVNNNTYKKVEGKCIRAAYYNCLGIPEESDTNINTELIFKIGDYTEQMILDLLSEKGVLFDSGVKFKIDKFNVSGKLDGIVLDEKGKKVGLEIKSIGSNKYTYSKIYGDKWNKPFPKWQNLLQTLVYCYAFRDTIDKFILMYIRRDTCEIKEFEISIIPKNGKIYPVIDGVIYEKFCIEDILDRYKILQKYISKKEVPPREFQAVYPSNKIMTYQKLGIISKRQAEKYVSEPFGDFECRYCGYAERCNGDK